MMYPLVRDLAAAGAPVRVPVAVTCRVLNLARQPYYRWLANPIMSSELEEAYRANALFDAHRDDPEFGYRFLVDEAVMPGSRWPPGPRGGSARTTLVERVREAQAGQGRQTRAAGPRRPARRRRREGPGPSRVHSRRP